MPEHPIWSILEANGQKLTWLARRIGYSYGHLKKVKYHRFPATAEFRAKCAEVLGLPESALFLPEQCSGVKAETGDRGPNSSGDLTSEGDRA